MSLITVAMVHLVNCCNIFFDLIDEADKWCFTNIQMILQLKNILGNDYVALFTPRRR